MSCAIVARDTTVVPRLVPGTASPVRALAADLTFGADTWHLVSAALPPGSTWEKAAKHRQARALTADLRTSPRPQLVGTDRNGPRHERWDPGETIWWPQDPAWFFAEDADHGCRDLLRRWYDANPGKAAEQREARPDGPLEVTYLERRTQRATPRRYDVLMATDDVVLFGLEHRFNDAVAAGSDHGLVGARVRLHRPDIREADRQRATWNDRDARS